MSVWFCAFGFPTEVLGDRANINGYKDSYVPYKYHLLSAYYIPGTVSAITHVA